MVSLDTMRYIDQLPGADTDEPFELRYGAITSIDDTDPRTVSVRLSGTEFVVDEIRVLNSYFPRVDEQVILVKKGGDLWVLGAWLNDNGEGLPTDPNFNSVTVDGNTLGTTSDPATGLSATPGIFLDNVYIDVTWTESDTSDEYQVELSEKVAGVYQGATQYRTEGNAIRIEHLKPQTTYGVRVYSINKLGISSLAEPPGGGFYDVTTGVDSTIPTLLTGFTVTGGFRSIVVTWNDTPDFDFDSYQLQLAQDGAMTYLVRDQWVRGSIGGWDDVQPDTMYYLRARTKDTSGNLGPWTAVASASTGMISTGDLAALAVTTAKLDALAVTGPKIADFAVDTAKIANLGVTTAKIGLLAVTTALIDNAAITNAKIGLLAVDTARIADAAILTAKIADAQITNAKVVDMVVDKLLAGTIASKDFVLGAGGQIKTAALAPGFVVNSQGISFYDGTGVRTIFLDSATGTGTFKGTISAGTIITAPILAGGSITGSIIKTSLSGNRIELQDNGGVGSIFFVTGDLNEYFLGNVVCGVAGSGFSRQLFARIESGAHSTSPGPARTHWYGDQATVNYSAVIEHYADRHAFTKGYVDVTDGDVVTQAASKGFYVAASNNDSATFKGTWGGQGGALRGTTGHAIAFEWNGVNFKIWVDGNNVRTL